MAPSLDHEPRAGPVVVGRPRWSPRPTSALTRLRRVDEGMATVWAVAWMFVSLMIAWLGALAAAIASAQHHLDAAADLSSLSAAAQAQRGGDACATAEMVAQMNSASLVRCDVVNGDVVVTVAASINLPFDLAGRMSATARAGPRS